MKPISKIMMVLLLSAAVAGFQWMGAPTFADDGGSILKVPEGAPTRKKQLHFEDELVEGMNRNPFDSLEHISNQDLRDSSHLYRKKANFKVEMKQHVREAGYSE